MAISKFWLDVFWGIDGREGGLVAIQSLFTNKKCTSPFNFQSNEPFFKVSTTINGHFKISSRCILGKYEAGGGVHPPIFWIFERALELSITSPMSPSEVYTIILSIHTLFVLPCPDKPCPEGYVGGGVELKDVIFGPFNYVQQNDYLKILIGCAMGNGGRGRSVSCPPITSTNGIGTGPFNLQSNSCFRSFYDNKLPSQNSYQMHFGKIRGMGGYSPSGHSES